MKRRVAALVVGSLAFWVVVVYPARWLGDDLALGYSSATLALCLVPAAVTLAWACGSASRLPEQQLLLALGGTAIRMFVVLSGALLLYLSMPYFQQPGLLGLPGFWLWLLLFYLFTLALEMGLLLAGGSAAENAHTTAR